MTLMPPWPKGRSGNPGGRPRGLGRYVREQLGEDGEEAVDFLLAVFRSGRRKHHERMEALTLLLAYGWGRPPQGIALAMTGDGEVTYRVVYEDRDADHTPIAVRAVDYRHSIAPLAPKTDEPDVYYRRVVDGIHGEPINLDLSAEFARGLDADDAQGRAVYGPDGRPVPAFPQLQEQQAPESPTSPVAAPPGTEADPAPPEDAAPGVDLTGLEDVEWSPRARRLLGLD